MKKIRVYILRILYIGCLGSLLASCEQTATNIDLPYVEPKLVVHGFISPLDTSYKIQVEVSKPIYGNRRDNVPAFVIDASVQVSDGVTTIPLSYDGYYESYVASTALLPIVPGKTYMLWVSTPDGKSISASCRVPDFADTASLKIQLDTTSVSSQSKRYLVDMEWRDIAGQANYYMAGGYLYSSDAGGMFSQVSELRNVISSDNYFSDEGNDGGTMTRRGLSTELDIYSYKADSISFFLISLEENYYKYMNSVYNSPGDFPFAEPYNIYTNIKGGLGIFAAYAPFYKTTKF